MAAQTLTELDTHFAIRDHVTFHEIRPDMLAIRIATAQSDATIYLQGAHVTQFTPHHVSPVLYLSPRTAFVPGKPIRGGIPVIFPWFGDRWNAAADDTTKSPAHGFARTSIWTVDRTHLTPAGEVVVVLSLAPTEQTAALGYAHFHATLEFRIGADLHMILTLTNTGTEPMPFEEAFHTYFAVDDIHTARIDGLRGSTYIDKRDDGIRKVQRETQFAFTRDIDQVHVHTAEPLTLHDTAANRSIALAATGSATTVLWNPWSVLTPGMADLPEDSWQHFACIETANAADDRITLAPGATHGMALTISLQPA